jgi:hypothetical protein
MGRRRRTWRILLKNKFKQILVTVFIKIIYKYVSVNYPFGDFDLTGLVSFNNAGVFFSFTDRRASSDIRCNSFEGVNFVSYKWNNLKMSWLVCQSNILNQIYYAYPFIPLSKWSFFQFYADDIFKTYGRSHRLRFLRRFPYSRSVL